MPETSREPIAAPSPGARAESMVLDAFSAAYGGGRESWETMTEGVLKNRLLQMSDRSFRVEDFGVDSLDSFIDLVPGTLERVEPSTPRSVRLTASGKSTVVDRGPGGTASGRHGRVREDLWNAILDYSAHGTWIWDPDAGEAVLTDEATGWTPECQLPTVTPLMISPRGGQILRTALRGSAPTS